MPGTKKLVIAIGVIVFLAVFLLVSFLTGREESTAAATLSIVSGGGDFVAGEVTLDASEPEPEFDRVAFVAKMRRAVLEREPDSIVVPQTEASEPEEIPAEPEPETVVFTGQRSVRLCDATVPDASFVANWPASEVHVADQEGALVIYTEVTQAVGTSSETVTSVRALAQYPLHPAISIEPNCLLHSYVGVTLSGRPIHNNDVIIYASKGESELIGYAFDGNPIYGVTNNTDSLDECGGYQTAGGYRYQLRADEDFVIGCFVSEPNQVMSGA